MHSQVQSISAQSQRFMCLEDRLLQALYKQEGSVSLQNLASPISITPNAALSIAHRIKSTYPEYLILEEEAGVEACFLQPIESQSSNVQQFLDKGGFTKINEDEFIKYYAQELKKEKRQALLRLYKAKIQREKWAIGVASLVGLGIVIATYLYRRSGQV